MNNIKKTYTMKLNYIKNKGLTLIEALIWFAIFAAVVAGIFTLYASSRNASNASIVNKELSTIFSQMEQLYANDDTGAITNGIGVQIGVFPSTLKFTDPSKAEIANVFGGSVRISGQSPSGFSIAYTNIPSGEVCSNIVRAQKSVGWDTGLGVSYNSTYTIAKVAAACGNNGGAAKTLTFVRLNSQI